MRIQCVMIELAAAVLRLQEQGAGSIIFLSMLVVLQKGVSYGSKIIGKVRLA